MTKPHNPRRRRAVLAAPLVLGALAISAQPAVASLIETDSGGALTGIAPGGPLAVGSLLTVVDDLALSPGDILTVDADRLIDAADLVPARTASSLLPDQGLLQVEANIDLDAGQILSVGEILSGVGQLPGTPPQLPVVIPDLPGVPVIVVPEAPAPVVNVPQTPQPGAPAPVVNVSQTLQPGGPAPAAPAPAASPAASSTPATASGVAASASCIRAVLRTKVTGPARLKAGKRGAYRITVRNRGRGMVTGASVRVSVPRGFAVVNRTPKAAKVRGRTVIWNVAPIRAQGARTLKVVLRVSRSATVRGAVTASTSAPCAKRTVAKRAVTVTRPARR